MIVVALLTILQNLKAMRNWPECTEINEERMLTSIKAIEGSGWKTGAKGEQGPFQINPKTWKEHSSLPVEVAPHYYHDSVAKEILRHYASILRKRGDSVTPYNLALAWCSGPYRKTHSKRAIDYASRLQNYYADETKHS